MTTFRKFWQEKPRTDYAEFFKDFLFASDYAAGDWTKTGGGTNAVKTDEAGGALTVTNTSGGTDSTYNQTTVEAWSFTEGKQTEFEIRFKISDVINTAFVAGLQITDTTPLAVSDGVFFRKGEDTALVSLVVCKNGAESVIEIPDGLVNGTYVTLNFYYDGTDNVQAAVNGVRKASLPITNLPDDELLAISFGLLNSSATAHVLTVDYLRAVQQR